MERHNKENSKRVYPYLSMILGIMSSLLITWLLVEADMQNDYKRNTALFGMFLAFFYWYAIYIAHKYFYLGSIGVWGVRLVNIGGLFLFVFGSFISCFQ